MNNIISKYLIKAPNNFDEVCSGLRSNIKLAIKTSIICFIFSIVLSVIAWNTSLLSFAQSFTLDLNQGQGSATTTFVQLIALITVISLAPSILIMVTSFVRIVIVLSILRTAIGTPQAPSNIVVNSLALFMTFFIMQPALEASWQNGVKPYADELISEEQAFERAVLPLKTFMLRQAREEDLTLFYDLAEITPPDDPLLSPLRVVIPGFMISELRRAFEIGFLIFVPFVVIDIVVATVLMSLGMIFLPPITVSLPFKLIFFVLIDGWYILVASLVQSFQPY